MYQIFSVYLKRLPLIVLLFFVSEKKNYAQSVSRIDSLVRVIKAGQANDLFQAHYDLAFEYYAMNQLESAVEHFSLAQQYAYGRGDSLRIVKSRRAKAQILRRLGNQTASIEELVEVLPIAKRNGFREEQETILNALAVTYTYQANYDKALECHFQNLALKEESLDYAAISASLNNIGIVYFKLKDHAKALEYYVRALEYDKKVEGSEFRDELLINIALCYNQLKEFDDAQQLLKEALEYCEPNCDGLTILHGEFGLGVSYYGQSRYLEAEEHFRRSLAIAVKINDRRFQAENLFFLSRVFTSISRYDSALSSLKKVEAISAMHGYNELLIDSYRQFSDVYSSLKDYHNASLYQQKYITLKDSIYSGELIDRIAKITTNFQERDNLKTIAAKEETIARQRSLNVAIGIIAILACALIFVLYRSIKINRRVNAALSDAKATIEDQNRQLRSSNVMLNEELRQRNLDLQKANDSLQRVNEELDNFIYKTSHDIRGPLASLKGMCNVALMDVKDPVALNYLEKLDITAEKLNTILTRLLIVNQINNSSLSHDRIDFEAIVDDILTLERKKGIPNRVRITREICPQTVFQADTQLVRIILENLIDNAIKFYNDSDRVEPFVHIRIGGNNQNVSIHVIDNGIGISEVHPDKIFQMFSRASERSETGGIGLYITKTAAEKLGGNVNLKTTPEGYTEFFVTLPQGS